MCYIILYYIILHNTILYHIILYYIISYHIILYHTILYNVSVYHVHNLMFYRLHILQDIKRILLMYNDNDDIKYIIALKIK